MHIKKEEILHVESRLGIPKVPEKIQQQQGNNRVPTASDTIFKCYSIEVFYFICWDWSLPTNVDDVFFEVLVTNVPHAG